MFPCFPGSWAGSLPNGKPHCYEEQPGFSHVDKRQEWSCAAPFRAVTRHVCPLLLSGQSTRGSSRCQAASVRAMRHKLASRGQTAQEPKSLWHPLLGCLASHAACTVRPSALLGPCFAHQMLRTLKQQRPGGCTVHTTGSLSTSPRAQHFACGPVKWWRVSSGRGSHTRKPTWLVQ